MSRLNAGAFEFVPGRSFGAPARPPPPAGQPIERPEQLNAPAPPPTFSLSVGGPSPLTRPPVTEAPAAPPTISLSIGGPAPAPASVQPPAPASKPAHPVSKPAPSAPAASSTASASASGTPSKTFTTEKAKTDTTAIAQEVRAAADESTLKDLYGDSQYTRVLSPI